MFQEVSKLVLYRDLGEDSILLRLSGIFEAWSSVAADQTKLISRSYAEIKRLLDLAAELNLKGNLWQNYLTFLLLTNENPFTLVCERRNPPEGTLNQFAKSDFCVFYALFHYDFQPYERDLGIDAFTAISSYQAPAPNGRRNCGEVGEIVGAVSTRLNKAADEDEFYGILSDFYREYGVGIFGLHRAFRLKTGDQGLEFLPVRNMIQDTLDNLVGYELQKQELRRNTDSFVEGWAANNVLLYGDSGTGKSTSVKALLNEYSARGLRMIEVYKHQFRLLSEMIAQIKDRNYAFIIFVDDLSFEEDEVEYKFLKAVIEGGVETWPENIRIYATSNRRHLIRETWNDRNDMEHGGDVHRSDTMEEKLSLSSRFGVQINYGIPTQNQYQEIVFQLARRQEIGLDQETLRTEAAQWGRRRGGVSGRTARQLVDYLAGGPEISG